MVIGAVRRSDLRAVCLVRIDRSERVACDAAARVAAARLQVAEPRELPAWRRGNVPLRRLPRAGVHADLQRCPAPVRWRRMSTTGVTGSVSSLQRADLQLWGLTCPACVRTVEEAIRGVPGVESASVNLATARAFVTYDSSRTSLAAIHDAIKKAGYRVGLGRARFHIKGMTCASCVTRIERALEGTPGVVRATVSLGAEEAEVEYALGTTDLKIVKTAVASAGYSCSRALASAEQPVRRRSGGQRPRARV